MRRWFVIHFVADLLFAIPLFLAPALTLGMFGWTVIDPVTTRLVAAALFGIGIESLLGRHGSVEKYRGMLRLKIIWSVTANLGLAWSIATGAPRAAWLFLGIFLCFSALWIHYAWRLRER